MKPIENYEDIYTISRQGEVLNIKTQKRRAISRHSHGYLVVSLYKERKLKQFYIHRLIATAFIPNPLGYSEINHKNGIKDDNRIKNLEWCTRHENMRHASRTGLLKFKKTYC